jgi:hypothetical protein
MGVRPATGWSLPRPQAGLYGRQVKVERHWWNGSLSPRERRDVFIRSDGQRWDVMAQVGGTGGRSKVHLCPGRATAEILADAWRGGNDWREVLVDAPEAAAKAYWPSTRSMS